MIQKILAALCVTSLACCSPGPSNAGAAAAAGIDSLNARIAQAYRNHDPKAYGALYTDSAVFEWPAFNTVRGARALEKMAEDNWASLKNMQLRIIVSTRRFAPDHATEFGAFEQSYSDASGKRSTEYGRYVAVLVPQTDGRWRMDRFFGFEDSTRVVSGHAGR
jgi:ketosteroid isomerase-like protein